MLSKEIIEKAICGVEVAVYGEIDSTNSEAKRAVSRGEALPQLICAETQTSGRGRLGRSFYSPEGTGLYMSLAFEPKFHMSDAVTITGAAAVAVSVALDELCGVSSRIKWVNDIYVCGKKVCGILAEAVSCGEKNAIVVGIGVNCTTDAFPDDITDRAGSVGKVDRNLLAAKIVEKLLFYADNLDKRLWLDEYRARSLVLGENIKYTENGVTRSAVALAIDNNGALIISENGQTKKLSTGEITVRIG